jgi:hypothetical protein
MQLSALRGWEQADAETLNAYMRYYSTWLGMPEDLLTLVAMKESSYDPETGYYNNSYSWAGAAGLMQLRPIALRDIQQRFGMSIDPMEPIQAIVGAALMFYLNRVYIRHYAKRLPDLNSLIVAYNGGWQMGLRYMRGQSIARESAFYLASIGGALGTA